jgi:hypothetical protein
MVEEAEYGLARSKKGGKELEYLVKKTLGKVVFM